MNYSSIKKRLESKIDSLGYILIYDQIERSGFSGRCNKKYKTVTIYLNDKEYGAMTVQDQCRVLCHELVHVFQFERGILLLPELVSIDRILNFLGLPITGELPSGYKDFINNKHRLNPESLLLDAVAYVLEDRYEYVLAL